MFKKGEISKNLREIEALYNQAKSPKRQFYFAKLATLELCGWLESAQDALIADSVNRCIPTQSNRDIVLERMDKTYGFDYERNFRPLLIQIVGLSKLEQIETEFDKAGSLAKFKSLLNKLKKPRNTAAHTHTFGVLPKIDAPSVVRTDLH